MPQTTTAIYENGVFQLLDPVVLQEGEEVKITVKLLNTVRVKDQEHGIDDDDEDSAAIGEGFTTDNPLLHP